MSPTPVAFPVIRALLDDASRKRYSGGVLGVLAKPVWDGPTEFEHRGVPVRVVACPSTLAVREALLTRAPDRWLVILTDQEETELGLGITAHLVWHRLRRPDLWTAVQDRFGATRIEHRLVSEAPGTRLPIGLLAAAPPEGWPPAPTGLLTRDHAFGAVAALRLDLGSVGEPLDLPTVLRWSARAEAATTLADLRALTGETLVDALITWVADRCGTGGAGIATLLRRGQAADAIPAGLVARAALATAPGSGPRALLGREVGGQLSDQVWLAWADEAEAVTRELLAGGRDSAGSQDSATEHDSAARVLARAELLLDSVEAGGLAGESEVLRRGLTARLAELGEALRRCGDRATIRADRDGPDAPLVDAALLPAVELARERVAGHALAQHPDESRVPRALAGVRLARWLAQPALLAATDFASRVAQHRDCDAWADRAITAAWTGVEDEALARGLQVILATARLRRPAHDAEFGRALAHLVGQGGQPAGLGVGRGTGRAGQGAGRAPKRAGRAGRPASGPAGCTELKDLLASSVLPLARQRPVLLVVADGMSQAVATEVVDDVVRRYDSWLECLPEERDRRIVAVAALPTVTKTCRASLLCGELTVGEQPAERTGLDALGKAYRVTTRLFHKVALDSSPDGYTLADEVRAAIDDRDGVQLVACVLNTIDDALDRSDPGGTTWSADTVKHLRPLLERARRAGRVVVLTSDHGHIVERRQGRVLPAVATSSNRSRPATSDTTVDEGEVRVRGRRVLLHDGDAILAVDERLRYGQIKAGYHGGGSPAEVVVPVSVLAAGEAPDGWRLAPPQSPAWWRGPVSVTRPEPAVRRPSGGARPDAPARPNRTAGPETTKRPESVTALTLFDAEPAAPGPVARAAASGPAGVTGLTGPAGTGLTGRASPAGSAGLADLAEPAGPAGLARAVLASAGYRQQRTRAARAAITDRQISDLLVALLAAPANRLDPESAAAALGVATVQLPGALSQAQRLLNLEQYRVLGRDPDGTTVVLDIDLLREQFEVGQ